MTSGSKKIMDRLRAIAFDKEKHLKIAQQWWLSYNDAYLDTELLPDLGVVVLDVTDPIAMGWIHLSNSGLAELSWVVTDPNTGPRARVYAVQKVLDKAESIVRSVGGKAIQILSDRKGLTKIARVHDYMDIRKHDYLMKYIK